MNIDTIKQSGFRLGLEAELNAQFRALETSIKNAVQNYKDYDRCVMLARNCVILLEELDNLHKATTKQN